MKKSKIALALVMAIGMTMTYGVKADCSVYNGWEKSNGYWYYYKNGNMCTGWQKDGSTWYYMNSDGTMKTGWINDGNWYYLKADGAMATGWQKVNGTWYYLNGDGSMKTGWLKDGDRWYYLNNDGSMMTDWLKDGSTWYYLKPDGSMATGWYHVNSSGKMVPGTIEIYTAKQYYFNKDGAWVEDTSDLFRMSTEDTLTTSSKSITVTIINRTDHAFEFDADQNHLQNIDKDGLWNILNLKKDRKKIGKKTVYAHSSVSYTIDVDTLECGKLEVGKYKVYNYLGDKYYSYEFEVTEPQEAALKTEHIAYSAKKDKEIKYSITNNSNSEMTYGEAYSIQKNVNGEWEDVPLKSDSFIEIAKVVKPGQTVQESFDIDNIDDKNHKAIKDGYRLVKKIDGEDYYADFILVYDKAAEK